MHTDNGKEFHNKEFDLFCEKYNIRHIYSSPYHPKSQGYAKSFNKEIKRLLTNKY